MSKKSANKILNFYIQNTEDPVLNCPEGDRKQAQHVHQHVHVCGGVKYNVLFSPTVPEAVMYCSTTAVYNGSTDELTDIVVNWSKAEVSFKCIMCAIA